MRVVTRAVDRPIFFEELIDVLSNITLPNLKVSGFQISGQVSNSHLQYFMTSGKKPWPEAWEEFKRWKIVQSVMLVYNVENLCFSMLAYFQGDVLQDSSFSVQSAVSSVSARVLCWRQIS